MKELPLPVKKVRKKPGERATLKKDRWYYVEIYPRDLEGAEGRFVGKLIAEEKDESVLQDQDGWLYYLRFAHFDIQHDFVSAYSEWTENGQTISDILADLNEVFEGEVPECPLLTGLVVPERNENT